MFILGLPGLDFVSSMSLSLVSNGLATVMDGDVTLLIETGVLSVLTDACDDLISEP